MNFIVIPTMRLDTSIGSNALDKEHVFIKGDTLWAKGLVVRGGKAASKTKVCAFFSEDVIEPMYERQV